MNDGVKLTVGRPDINKAIIPSTQISDSTSSGRTLLTASTRQAQRELLSTFVTYASYAALVAANPAQLQRAYITLDTGRVYYWNGTSYVGISPAEADVTINAVTNGNFSNTAGLTPLGGGWYDGVPNGWTSTNPPAGGYTIKEVSAGIYSANLAQLSTTAGATSFKQDLGILPITSSVTLTFDGTNDFSSSSWEFNAFIYDESYNTLAYAVVQEASNQVITASNVSAGTRIIIGFYNIAGNPGIRNVSVSQPTKAQTWIFPTNLPKNTSNLPVGGIYVDSNDFIKIKSS